MKRILVFLYMLAFSFYSYAGGAVPDANGIIYVKKGATGDGSSWANAIAELADALRDAGLLNNATPGTVKEIWVTQDSYKPKYDLLGVPATRTSTFLLVNDVKMYGGFLGTESSIQMRPQQTTTKLDGDIGVATDNTDNCNHVVLGIELSQATVLDRFAIVAGNADGSNPSITMMSGEMIDSDSGGGMYLTSNSSPIFKDVLFSVNSASGSGGALFVASGGSPYLEDCLFRKNTAGSNGGGVMLKGLGNPVFIGNIFYANSAEIGGGIYSGAKNYPQIYRSEFSGNEVTIAGAGYSGEGANGVSFSQVKFAGNIVKNKSSNITIGGGAVFLYYLKESIFKDVLISGNASAAAGGGIYLFNTSSILINCTISGNSAVVDAGGVMANGNKSINIFNSVIKGNSGSDLKRQQGAVSYIANSLVGGVTSAGEAGNNLDESTNPLFQNAPDYTTAPFTGGDYTLTAGSPLVNAGDNSIYPSIDTAWDLAGNDRLYDRHFGGIVDIGAYESTFIGHTVQANDIQAIYGDVPVVVVATTSTGLPLNVSAIDNNIAEAYQDSQDNKWKLTLKNAGETLVSVKEIRNDGTTGDSITFKLTVSPAVLTVTAKDSTLQYNGQPFNGGNGVEFSGFVNGDDEQAITGIISYSGNAQGAVDAGNYAIKPSGLTANNYTFTYVDATLKINRAPLTITAKDTTKIYDGLGFSKGNGVVYSGLVNGENELVIGGTLVYTGNALGAINAGIYDIIPSGLQAANYTITYVKGSLSVMKAPLTITAKDFFKDYDGLPFSGGNGVNYSGFVNGEDEQVLTGTVSYQGNAQGAMHAGTFNLSPSGLTAVNYEPHFIDGTLEIGKATLTVVLKDSLQTYNGQPFLQGSIDRYVGFVNGDDESVLTGTISYTGTAQGAINAGTYIINAAGLSAADYSVFYKSAALKITKAPLTVTARDVTKTYDGAAFSKGNGAHFSGFKGDDDEQTISGTLSYGGSALGAINAGIYTITISGLSAANYELTYASGILDIQPAVLNVVALDASRCYGTNNPVFNVKYEGFIGTDDETVLISNAAASTVAGRTTVAGQYPITAYGGSAANYTMMYKTGTLTIHALPVSQLTAVQGAVLCGPGSSVPLVASGNFSFTWYLNQLPLPGITTGSVNADNTGFYTAVATDVNGCSASASNSILVSRQEAIIPDFNFDQYCAGTHIPFINTTNTGNTPVIYNWATSDGQSTTNLNAGFSFANAGPYTVKLTVAPQICPTLTREITKDISIEAPVPGITLPAVSTLAGVPVSLPGRPLSNAIYNWTPAAGLSNSRIANPTATLTSSQLYQVKMTFPSGCSTTDQVQVNVLQQAAVLVANVFSPNGDGNNDLLLANLRGLKQLRYFRVYNRAGKKVFETSDAGHGWDGRLNGVLQPLASYVWTSEAVDFNGNTVRNQGTVTLLR